MKPKSVEISKNAIQSALAQIKYIV